MAGFAGGLVVEELLVSAAHTSPATLAPVLPYITVQYSIVQYSTVGNVETVTTFSAFLLHTS